MYFDWTAERVEKLKALWKEGLSGARIAAELGCDSRSAVIGKVHRLGLPGRITKDRKAMDQRRSQLNQVRARPTRLRQIAAVLRSEALPITPASDVATVSFADLMEHHCRWPVGDPRQQGFGFCGCSKVSGLPYCEGHAKRAFQVPDPRRPHHNTAERRTERPAVSLRPEYMSAA